MEKVTKEWCSITLLNRFNICLQFEFNIKQLDLIMVGFQLTKGLGFTVLGVTIALDWKSI
jgi:hypothetical protein